MQINETDLNKIILYKPSKQRYQINLKILKIKRNCAKLRIHCRQNPNSQRMEEIDQFRHWRRKLRRHYWESQTGVPLYKGKETELVCQEWKTKEKEIEKVKVRRRWKRRSCGRKEEACRRRWNFRQRMVQNKPKYQRLMRNIHNTSTLSYFSLLYKNPSIPSLEKSFLYCLKLKASFLLSLGSMRMV